MRKFLYILCTVLMVMSLLFGSEVLAGDYGLSRVAQRTPIGTHTSIPTMIGNALGTVLALISVIFFGLMIYSGITWMTARGNEQQETKARDNIIAAVLGILVILGSYALVKFVFGSL